VGSQTAKERPYASATPVMGKARAFGPHWSMREARVANERTSRRLDALHLTGVSKEAFALHVTIPRQPSRAGINMIR
jgi:hypothetical protein